MHVYVNIEIILKRNIIAIKADVAKLIKNCFCEANERDGRNLRSVLTLAIHSLKTCFRRRRSNANLLIKNFTAREAENIIFVIFHPPHPVFISVAQVKTHLK